MQQGVGFEPALAVSPRHEGVHPVSQGKLQHQLHTFDGCDLFLLNGKLPKKDGASFLKICKPPEKPDPNEGTLLKGWEAP